MMRSTSMSHSIANSACSPAAVASIVLCAMPKQKKKSESESNLLKGWQQIAAFLSQPVSVAQRWATEAMPVRKQGRYVETSREELNRWLGRESAGEPVQIATPETDLNAELKRGLSFVRKHSRGSRNKAA
jgi:hypothetical protein